MADFRERLYANYVSTFKGAGSGEYVAPQQAYWRWCDSILRPLLRQIAATSRVLEVGCGQGRLLAYMQNLGFQDVRGIDVSEEQIRIAQSAGLQVEVSEASSYLREHRASFDVILAFDFLEHFSKEELLDLLALIHDSLRTGGVLIAQTVNGQGVFPNQVALGDLTHLTILNPSSLQQVLRYTGFEVTSILETNPGGSGIVGGIRRAAWCLIKCFANGIRWIETGKTQAIWTENMICVCRKP